ncbi:MAG: chemotaxis protein CheW [Panacagrimonas sp.]|jgi:twitching motility protein PilI|nr:chemotaxis protein CheW [Panacagrimonas sp.]MCC2656589.1 chemotaxis protein CheW [Panacagrimonas sp.]
MTPSLRQLRDDPYRLLAELDRRLRAMREEAAGGRGQIWQGLAFRQGERWMVTPKDDVREVIPPPRFTRVPNSKPWLAGVANVRGSLLTLVDLGLLSGGDGSASGRTARVLVLNSDQMQAGFLVDEVAGYRQFTAVEQAPAEVSPGDAMAPYVLGGFSREGRAWQVLSLHKLAQSETLRRAGW